jgi:YesN/AraC family two-component response regulator
MHRILIVDDNPVVRCGLKQIVADALPSVVIGEARDAAEAVETVGNRSWDIVLLDITMPGRGCASVVSRTSRTSVISRFVVARRGTRVALADR